MTQYCYLNGEILPLVEAKVSILDIGLLRGFGIYDALPVINGKPLRLSDHWQRFVLGANALNINIPITEDILEDKIIEITEKSGYSSRANVRMILTGGQAIGGIEYDFQKPTFFVIVEKWESLSKENYINGAKLITSNHRREIPKLKTTNYIEAVHLQNSRKEQGAVEILYVHNNEVLECATSNVFLVKNNTLITPEEGILEGVTRKIVLEIAEKDYKIEKREVSFEEFKLADEVFITSSFKDVMPIVRVDDFVIGNGGVGEVTKDLMSRFKAYIYEN